METLEEQNPIAEARRYVANAAEIIVKSKYDPETKLYRDKKYVRIAGDTLWKGCLIALDALLHVRKGKGRPSIEKYKKAAAQRDHKLLSYIVAGYETMHLVMGYDGNKEKKVSDAGFERANAIIDRCAILMPGTVPVPAPTLAAVSC
ncbi:MAG: DUF5618 family protein [Bacteroidales bacterium]|nr:DUF5618 family protein [Bacteroidales bacterium]MBR6064098.1 DUF5618 family protein [Bacteroidales bacterium]